MITSSPICLVILAGGQSVRMGTDKAAIRLDGQRLIDIVIGRFASAAEQIMLSARDDYDTGLEIIPDDPLAPGGPVGGIFSVAARLQEIGITGFVTVPVDAPHAPVELIARLTETGQCAVAGDQQRIHPTFGHWLCDTVNGIREAHQPGERAPSLHWLAERCGAEVVRWQDPALFLNINQPEDLERAASHKKTGA
ncbi:molybdenum cofactor guanylyltransferase [Parasphingorhabdus sp.]|uniref:molybdenum cofactor guanylyltransferase n=1 Tax=Parasphingorhabdus sp. TaxID=2709688 RepID=UPI0030015CF1